MNVLIFTDMEGPSGIDQPEMVDTSTPELYEKGRFFTTEDVNAAIRGLWRAGAQQVDVFDGHGMGGNIIVENLEEDSRYLGGGWMTNLRKMIEGGEIGSYDALVLLGQHAAQGTKNGFLSHTNTGMSALRINGKFAGEAPQIAWLAGYYQVPTLMVVGDDALVREVRALLPGVQGIVVKTSQTRHRTTCIPVDEAHALIEETAFRKLNEVEEMEPCQLSGPIQVEIFFALEEPAELLAQIVGFEKTGERVVAYMAQDFLEAFWAYHSCRVMIQAGYRSLLAKWLSEREDGKELIGQYLAILREKYRDTTDLLPEVAY
jgi:D-amino peptidase